MEQTDTETETDPLELDLVKESGGAYLWLSYSSYDSYEKDPWWICSEIEEARKIIKALEELIKIKEEESDSESNTN